MSARRYSVIISFIVITVVDDSFEITLEYSLLTSPNPIL